MEVIYLISRAKATGPVNQALNILIGLNRQPDIHATLVTLDPEGDISWLHRFKENNIDILQLNQSYWGIFKAVRMLNKYIRKNNVTIVHSAGYRADFVNMLLCKNRISISTQRCQPNEMVEKFPKLFRYPFEKYHLRIIQKMDAIVACSKSLQDHFRKYYGLDVLSVQNGVNTDLFTPVDINEKNRLRANLCLPQNKITYITVGRLSERKNVGLLIDAFKRIGSDNIQLIILGSGPLEEDLKDKASNDSRIIFIGSTPQPRPYLQASDIFLSASKAEGLPNTVLEALACGLPCILSSIDPHKELIANTKAGIIFDQEDINSLSNTILDSINWDIHKLAIESRNLVERDFSINRLASQYIDVYEKLRNEICRDSIVADKE